MKRRKCQKTCYTTYREAQVAIEGMARRFPLFLFKRPYRCGRCRCWHITSTPPVKGRRRQW